MADTTTPKLTRNATTSVWEGSQTLDAQSKKYTFATENKFVDKNIEFTAKVRDGSGSITGGGLNHGDITSGSGNSTYLVDSSSSGVGPITFSNTASRAAATFVPGTAGWIDSASDVTSLAASGNSSKSVTKYIKKGSASVTGKSFAVSKGTPTRSGSTISIPMSGSTTVQGSATAGWVTGVNSATVSASGTGTVDVTTLDDQLVAANIVKGKTVLGITGTSANDKAATYGNAPATNLTATDYKDISDTTDAPILAAEGYLYINEGRVQENTKISLAKLIPDDANLSSDAKAYLLTGYSAYDKDGKLISGSMAKVSLSSSLALALSDVTQDTTNGGFKVTATPSGSVSINTGYVTSSSKSAPAAKSIAIPQSSYTLTGGGLTAGNGEASMVSNGYYATADGAVNANDKIVLTTTKTAGYYEIDAKGAGSVTRGAVNSTTGKGYTLGESKSIAEGTQKSNTATTHYYIKKSNYDGATYTANTTTQKITIPSGYYSSDRTVTINPASSGTKATFNVTGSVSATQGSGTPDTTNNKYNIALTLAGKATASCTTAGYVAVGTIGSKDLSGSATVQLSLFDGSYTVA